MKSIIVKLMASIPFLGINWAALHDITSGESNVYLEYSVVITSIVLVSFILVNRYIKLKQNRI